MHLILEPQNTQSNTLQNWRKKQELNNNSCRLPLWIMGRTSKTENQHRYNRLGIDITTTQTWHLWNTLANNCRMHILSSTLGTFSRINYFLGHKTSLKFKSTKIIQSMFSHNNGNKLEINNLENPQIHES